MPHLLLYGDSNTHGTLPMSDLSDDGRLTPDTRWAGHLARGLGGDWRVTVEGLPGRTAVLDDPVEGAWKNGLTVLPAILESHAPVDAVAIMLGTNDQKTRFSLRGLDIALAVGRLARTVRAFAPEAHLLLICPPAVKECGPLEMLHGAETRCADLPKHLAEVARTEGAAFFDANTVICVDPLDGVHFGPEAHETLGRALVAPVQELLA